MEEYSGKKKVLECEPVNTTEAGSDETRGAEDYDQRPERIRHPPSMGDWSQPDDMRHRGEMQAAVEQDARFPSKYPVHLTSGQGELVWGLASGDVARERDAETLPRIACDQLGVAGAVTIGSGTGDEAVVREEPVWTGLSLRPGEELR